MAVAIVGIIVVATIATAYVSLFVWAWLAAGRLRDRRIMDKKFLDKLLAVMIERDLTFEDVADAVDVSLPTVQRWVCGLETPHPFLRPLLFKKLESLDPPDRKLHER